MNAAQREGIDGLRQAVAVTTREVAHPRNHSRLWHAREELKQAVRLVADHYSLSDSEVVMLMCQATGEYAERVGLSGIGLEAC